VLDLSILGQGGNAPVVPPSGNLSADQLGNLSPAAGGNTKGKGKKLGDLSPSAGGIQGNTTVTCTNSFLADPTKNCTTAQ
jgi:hypothetical protein